MIPLSRSSIGPAEFEAVTNALRSASRGGRLTQGPEVEAFEAELAAFCGVKHAVAMSSGTAALMTVLRGFDMVPSFGFPATANTAEERIRFLDVNPETWCSEDAAVQVDLFGLHIPSPHALVYDAACSLGAFHGAYSDTVLCVSFHPRKTVTTGEGGAVLANDDLVADMARAYRDHGRRDGVFQSRGYNLRMDEMSAALGRVQLRRLPDFLAERQEIAAYYRETIRGVEFQHVPEGAKHSYQTFAVKLPEACDRAKVIAYLADHHIESGPGAYACHTLPAYAPNRQSLPVAEALGRRVLAIPMFNGMAESDMATVARALNQAVEVCR